MTQEMTRFLTSLGLNDIERFDLSFDRLERNPNNKDVWEFLIRKETPWEYYLLREFLAALSAISYRYHLQFVYSITPKPADVIALFEGWYSSIYLLPPSIEMGVTFDDMVEFVFHSDQEEAEHVTILKDFKAFLAYIGYQCHLLTRIEITAEEKIIIEEQEEMALDSDETSTPVDEVIIPDEDIPLPSDEDAPVVVEEVDVESHHKENIERVETKLADEMARNLKQMEEDRRNALVFKRGDYAVMNVREFDSNSGNVDFNAKVFSTEIRATRKKTSVMTLGVADPNGDAVYVKLIENKRLLPLDKIKLIKRGQNIRVRGAVTLDYDGQLIIMGHYLDLLPEDPLREDTCVEKRIELHLHTKMSNMDGLGTIKQYCRVAANMGHKAIAITDHGVVQGYPDAQAAAKEFGLKMIYGCEMYMIDTIQRYIFNPSDIELNKASYVVFDFETTGLSAKYDHIIEFGAVKVVNGLERSRIDILINPGPGIKLSEKIIEITNITDTMLANQPSIEKALPQIMSFIGDSILVSHNAEFDVGFLNEALRQHGYPTITNPVVDTLPLSRYMFPQQKSHRLGALARNMEVVYEEARAHRGDYDAEVLNHVWQAMLAKLTASNQALRHSDLAQLELKKDLFQYMRPKHVIVLAKNQQGLKDLYRLVSLSHIEYYADVPKIPRHILQQYREHLLIGSACFNGEVFDAALTKTEDVLERTMKFYDYIELQPPENYSFLIHMGTIASEQILYRYLNDIKVAARKVGKLIVATGDAHYVDPSDHIYRDVYISAKGVGGVNHPLSPYDRENRPPFENPEQHYRSTVEMLDAFKLFCTEEEAKEMVINNPNTIANSIESLSPIKSKLFTPKIDNVETMLKDLCYKTAHTLYGDPLPDIIADRLKAELDGIISNGYSVIYYIAHKIIKKANDDGFMVGSRGSVGSSLVATMTGITEVNPLPPHYRCPKCQHSDFTPVEGIYSGYDLPDKKCPKCHTVMVHDGQNIPFATFLGFNAEKVPDIDLNFPGDYQAQAHEYTKELLGAENVFRAGTIETVAEKTAFGYARGYFERMGYDLTKVNKAQISYLAAYCQDVKRTTGQHPGGIVVIPSDYEVYDFTPIQYPADNMDASWKTTHLDFHAIHDNVLKLDLLGHVDPMALKMMGDMTGVDINTIPMNDKKVISIFSSPKALKLNSNYLGVTNGALAIPEFGTNFVRGMLDGTKPQSFSDLVILSGLSHGTDVYFGNAEELIRNKVADLRGVIGCRDDIMTYLSSKGLPAKTAFAIMEDVRKGKKLKPEYVELMKEKAVPQYYIDSCNKIQYLFPKAHATAYVMMAIRVGWFKVYRPLEFYATFFSVRAKQYDLETMMGGEKAIIRKLDEFKARRSGGIEQKLSPKEEEIDKTLTIALEMVERGYRCGNIDIYRSEASKFIVDHEKQSLIPPFTVVDGLGEAAAFTVLEERKKTPFISVEDLVSRTKLNSQNVENLRRLGVFTDLPEKNQLDIFDFC